MASWTLYFPKKFAYISLNKLIQQSHLFLHTEPISITQLHALVPIPSHFNTLTQLHGLSNPKVQYVSPVIIQLVTLSLLSSRFILTVSTLRAEPSLRPFSCYYKLAHSPNFLHVGYMLCSPHSSRFNHYDYILNTSIGSCHHGMASALGLRIGE